jgi:hypothetical protein
MSTFTNYPDIEKLAAAVHGSYVDGARKSAQDAEMSTQPEVAWKTHPAVMRAYDDLPEDLKASNRAAARRVPDLLGLIDFVVREQQPNDGDSWVKPLTAAIERTSTAWRRPSTWDGAQTAARTAGPTRRSATTIASTIHFWWTGRSCRNQSVRRIAAAPDRFRAG